MIISHEFHSLVLMNVILIIVKTSSSFKVYVVGEDGILEELKLAGFECFGGPVRHAWSSLLLFFFQITCSLTFYLLFCFYSMANLQWRLL